MNNNNKLILFVILILFLIYFIFDFCKTKKTVENFMNSKYDQNIDNVLESSNNTNDILYGPKEINIKSDITTTTSSLPPTTSSSKPTTSSSLSTNSDSMPPPPSSIPGYIPPYPGNMTDDMPPPQGNMTGYMPPSTGNMTGYMPPSTGNMTGDMPPHPGYMPPHPGSMAVDIPPSTGNMTGEMPPPPGSMAVDIPPPNQIDNYETFADLNPFEKKIQHVISKSNNNLKLKVKKVSSTHIDNTEQDKYVIIVNDKYLTFLGKNNFGLQKCDLDNKNSFSQKKFHFHILESKNPENDYRFTGIFPNTKKTYPVYYIKSPGSPYGLVKRNNKKGEKKINLEFAQLNPNNISHHWDIQL